MNFFVFLVSLLPISDSLFYRKGLENKIGLFEEQLMIRRSPIKGMPWSLRVLHRLEDHSVIAGYISRPRSAHLHDSDFVEHEATDFPPVLWIWDKSEQVLLVQKKTSVFDGPDATTAAFHCLINPGLLDSGIRSHIYPKSENGGFQNAYRSMEHVYSVEFEFVLPNFLGGTHEEAKKLLDGIGEDTNAQVVKATYDNPDGNIKMNLQSARVDNSLKWIKDGGGKWKLKGKQSRKGKKVVKSSIDAAKMIAYPDGKILTKLRDCSVKEIIEVLKALRPNYAIGRKK